MDIFETAQYPLASNSIYLQSSFQMFTITVSKLKQWNPYLLYIHPYKRLLIWNKCIKRNETIKYSK